ncbi:MAG TPA: amino acid permease [Pyrinomonadaceae bacterium]|jgi:APA family basic amino acid/polyamine antiporter
MQLKRQFGLWTAIALLVGQSIAVGIFLTPAGMAKSVGSPFWVLAIWVLMGAMTLSGALCYGELAARFPEAGGSYVYLREVWGRPLAFLYGWMCLLVLDPGLTATFAVGLTKYFVYLVPLSAPGETAFAVSVVMILGLINILGAKVGANFLKVLTVLKIGTLIFIIAYGFLGGFGDWRNFTPFYDVPDDAFGALAGGVVAAFFAFAGWWEVTRIAGEVENPNVNLPKALALGVLSITLIYILTSAVFFYLVPLANVTDNETFAAQAGEVLFGKTGGVVFAAIVIVSVLATLLAYLMFAPRVYYAMAKDGLFFRAFGELHPRFETPHRATIIQMVFAAMLILSGTFEQIISYFFFIVVFFIALTVAGIFRIHEREFSGYKTFLYPLTPVFFLLITGFVLLLIALKDPLRSFLGAAVVLSGLPVYYLILGGKQNIN